MWGIVKELLARRLLDTVVYGDSDDARPSSDEVAAETAQLTRLAALKYDEYEGYSPAVKFLESLAIWLSQLEPSDRRGALRFVNERLLFISAAEMDHLVGTIYPDRLRPYFIRKAAHALGVSHTRVRHVTASVEFQELHRRTLIMGMSDGARLDKLRRASSFSTEQFHLVSTLDVGKQEDLRGKLADALSQMGSSAPANFATVVVVDDFTASGTTMLRPVETEDSSEKEGAWEGKLVRLREHLVQLKDAGIVAADARIVVLIYLMTQKSRVALAERMRNSGLESEFELRDAHTFGEDVPLVNGRDDEFLRIFEKYFQEEWVDEHNRKAGHPRFGFADSRLPLVLHHNAPNNTPPVVWKQHDPATGSGWSGVFPRHERHSSERP
ncbi:hypothetical protein AB6V29_09355 [Microbacterium sp. 20-116]|uniref:phosphoribosyltransferase-like protein n=1 Tax=Microbacterium sp. 20-116 TaxID=3239883 RepID=UPI0034E2E2EB